MSQAFLGTLTTDAEWVDLAQSLEATGNNPAVKGVLKQLRDGGAVSVLTESDYLDQDFTAVYAAFYATVFRRHTKVCRRLHFFKEDVTEIIDNAEPEESALRLQQAGDRSYLGFIVARPIAHAPLGRVVLTAPLSPDGMRSELLVCAGYETHVLGATLKVTGIAMTQQDSRVGACAQASMWMAVRHFHVKNRGPWFSTVAITEAATKISDQNISKSLPAGSDFLSVDNMVRGLREMGREPLCYSANVINPGVAPPVQWSNVKPHEIISRYVDSGIPVILGLVNFGQNVGHAVVATGHTLKTLPPGYALPTDPTCAEFCDAFLVNDDQRGANLRLAINGLSANNQTPFTVFPHVAYIIVPLPKKVLIPAEAAEKLSREMIGKYASDWESHKAIYPHKADASIPTGDQFVAAVNSNKIIARTYLTYGWKYKERMLRNSVGREFKSALYYHDLPKFVWITEFGTMDSLNHLDPNEKRIFAHAVIDATASKFWETKSIFHAPGMGIRHYHNEANPFGPLAHAATYVTGDEGYLPKTRGA